MVAGKAAVPSAVSGYAASTHSSPYWVVRYPHQARFAAAARLIRDAHPDAVLDYGAGDGYLFTKLAESGSLGCRAVGYEPVPKYSELFRTQTSGLATAGETPILIDSLGELDGRTFDVIVCMSVLEHMPLHQRQRFYATCEQHLNPRGRIIVEVPIEVGLTVVIKEIGRVLLKRRRPEHSWRQLVSLTIGRRVFDPARFDFESQSSWIQDHAGFDYRLFRQELEHRFRLVDVFTTPLPRLPPWFGNQEVFYVLEMLSVEERAARSALEAASTPL